jgi:two-component system chemotaxis response regulator CheB
MSNPLKIVIIEESRPFCDILEEKLVKQEDFDSAGSCITLDQALEVLKRGDPDVFIADVDHPDALDLLAAVQERNKSRPEEPGIGVILVARRSRRDADVTIKALEAGAFDFVIRQEMPNQELVLDSLVRQLTVKLRHFSSKRIFSSLIKSKAEAAPSMASVGAPPAAAPSNLKALVMGVSTGGPKVLADLLPKLTRATDLPVFIVQHMPIGFTRSLAGSLDAKCAHRVIEAEDGGAVTPRTVYIAPGGKHMTLANGDARQPVVRISDEPPEDGCRPSVNVLFRSAARMYGEQVAAIILTGMGSDGTKGLRDLKSAGAYSIVQDEPSSVVWGMPGSAVAAGLVDKVLPPDSIPEEIRSLVRGKRSGIWN